MLFDCLHIRIRHGMLLLATFCLFMLFVFEGCSESGSDADDGLAGGITDIGNSVATVQVAGVVLNQDGSSAVSARVVAYYDSWNQAAATDSVVVFSDSNGRFVLDVDSSADLILFAELEGACGLMLAETRDDISIVLGPRKGLEGSVSGANSGYVRVVGTDEVAKISKDGFFTFENVPPGDISLVYFRDDKPQGHLDFKTMDNRDMISLPPMENCRDDGHCYMPEYNDEMLGVDFARRDDPRDSVFRNIALHMDGRTPVFNESGDMAGEVSFVEGIADRAVELAPGQYIDLGEVNLLSDDFTLSLWTKWEGASETTQILFSQKEDSSDDASFQWYFDGNVGQFAVVADSQNSDPVYLGESASVPAGSWSFLVLVCRGGSLTMYVDGIELKSANVDNKVGASVAHLHVGGSLGANEYTWKGPIDEVHVDGVAQSVGWIKFIYEETLNPKNHTIRK